MALNEWCNDLFRCKETLHPHNHVCVCVGRCREESILKFSETFVFRYIIRPMSDIPTQ